MIVLVCGGRSYGKTIEEYEAVFRELDKLHDRERKSIKEIVCGGAKGADSIALLWAGANDVPTHVHMANWEKYGRFTTNGAGPRRNAEMLSTHDIDLVVAFPGGSGTADMVRKALIKGINVHTPQRSKGKSIAKVFISSSFNKKVN